MEDSARPSSVSSRSQLDGPAPHEEIEFAPADPYDGRDENDWHSRYTDWRCVVQIIAESLYLGFVLFAAAAALLVVWLGRPQEWLDVSSEQYATFQTYAYAWTAGVLGGALLALKWLYHSVARGFWNADRLAWRIFTPHLSGALAFGLIALITSEIFQVLNRDLIKSGPAVVGLSLVLGYFSDFTLARLYRLARDLLGSPHDGTQPRT